MFGSGFRFAMPWVVGRGAGLGNELIPWGRAFVLGAALGLRPLPPAWGLNWRRYHKLFGTSRFDWAIHRTLPYVTRTLEFTEKDLIASPTCNLFEAAMMFGDKYLVRRGNCLIITKGLWGGYEHIRLARDHLFAELLQAPGIKEELARLEFIYSSGAAGPVIALHIRKGDFKEVGDLSQLKGRFNSAIPIEWYCGILSRLWELLRGNATIMVGSDAPSETLRKLPHSKNLIFLDKISQNPIVHMLAMSKADLLICSVSSFSMAAQFFGRNLYVWPKEQLTEVGQYLSIWGNQTDYPSSIRLTCMAINQHQSNSYAAAGTLGYPIALGEEIPPALNEDLQRTVERRATRGDLLRYGVVKRTE